MMAVRFNSPAGAQYLSWGTAPSAAIGLTSKTIAFKIKVKVSGANKLWIASQDPALADADDEVMQVNPGALSGLKVSFKQLFTSDYGVWTTTNDVLTVNTTHSVVVTYSGAATTNNPIIYIDGVSKAITENSTPVGTIRTGKTVAELFLGSRSTYAPNIEIEDLRIYNVIKTAAQALVISNEDIETDATIDETSLVFHAPLTMCKGLTYATFVGSTLAAGNTFFDRKTGYLGTPTGSPLGA